jgi:hypothetical protein
MRTVKYKTYWSYLGPGVPREGTLADLILDIPYLMDVTGVIPPLHVLNEVLEKGGDNGGMGPGTTWRRFKINEAEYAELVEALLSVNPREARERHPYVAFDKVIVDEELNNSAGYIEWVYNSANKYRKNI